LTPSGIGLENAGAPDDKLRALDRIQHRRLHRGGERMSQKITQSELKPAQLRVIERLAAGASISDAAEAGGVRRETVHRWLRQDIEFRAKCNALRAEMLEATELNLLAVAESATATLLAAVQKGNVPAAVAVLRGLGMLAGDRPRIGSADPAELAENEKLAEIEREQAATLRRLIAGSL
jgi:hypothetical protein